MSFAGSVDANGMPKTLYVGNLDTTVTEDLIMALFGSIGVVKGCKIIYEPGNDPYCFVEFADHASAAAAMLAMNKRVCLGKELKVNWASSSTGQTGQTGPKPDTSRHHHIFVGDLSPNIDTPDLREAFAPFGEISDCRVVKDPSTQKSKGYGFVSFVSKEEAENAITMMNGSWLGSRAIRTNWATRKPPSQDDAKPGGYQNHSNGFHKQLNYEDIFNQSSPNNCTVYCGGISQGLNEEIMKKAFQTYGQIVDIRIFKDKGYAFVRFTTKEAAAQAIVSKHNTEVNGQMVKCSWGKEQGPEPQGAAAAGQMAQYPYNPYQQMNYWYPQGTYPAQGGGDYMQNAALYNPYAAAATPAAYYGQAPYGMAYGIPGQAPMGGAQAGAAPQYPYQSQ